MKLPRTMLPKKGSVYSLPEGDKEIRTKEQYGKAKDVIITSKRGLCNWNSPWFAMLRMSTKNLIIMLTAIFSTVFLMNYVFYKSGIHTIPTIRSGYREDRPMKHVPLNLLYREQPGALDDISMEFEESKPAYMINTPGCKMPIILQKYNASKNVDNATCGRRMVFLKKEGYENDSVEVTMDERVIAKLVGENSTYHCCSYFFDADKWNGTVQTKCTEIRDRDIIPLETEYIGIKCYKDDDENTIYEDVYSFTKTKKVEEAAPCNTKYNVLIIGVNSMSLSKFSQTMTRTVNLFKENNWLGFRGYHKLTETSKMENLMTAFIGHDVYMGTERCTLVAELCRNPIWNQFKDAGYVTAFGEDHVTHLDSINRHYSIFDSPTHHYINPFFQKTERAANDDRLVCSGQKTSGQQLLDYAYDFALTYRKSSFFGFFWLNSFSNYAKSYREDADKMLEDFFNRLAYTGVLSNTFVILVSDHGSLKPQQSLEAFYDLQAPAFFMYLPLQFTSKFPTKLMPLKINQFRLITPFDVYDTLDDIRYMAQCKEKYPGNAKVSGSHHSLMKEVASQRTCDYLGIDFQWCSCNRLYSLEKVLPTNLDSIKSVKLSKYYIQDKINSTKTINCTRCADVVIKNVTSLYYMIDRQRGNLYHHMTFSTNVKDLFYEATVSEKTSFLDFISAKPILPSSMELGNCAIIPEDHPYCVCQELPNCHVAN